MTQRKRKHIKGAHVKYEDEMLDVEIGKAIIPCLLLLVSGVRVCVYPAHASRCNHGTTAATLDEVLFKAKRAPTLRLLVGKWANPMGEGSGKVDRRNQ